jgi:DNA gyrase/topoisomerase IV subunit B
MEVVSNGVDQFLQGFAATIQVCAEGQRFEVLDDGAGLDRGKARQHLCKLHFTPTADRHAPHIHLAPRGVGICVVNALASELTIESFDAEGGWRQTFRRGELHSEQANARSNGTTVQVILDTRIFGKAKLPIAEVRRILFDAVHLFPGLRLVFNEETFFSKGGLVDLAEFEAANRGMGSRSDLQKKENVRFGNVYDGPELSLTCAVVGLLDSDDGAVSSWVNGVLTPGNGTHVDGLRDALREVGWRPASMMLHVVMKEPHYAGPTRDKLDTPKVRGIVRDALLQPLASFLSAEGKER